MTKEKIWKIAKGLRKFSLDDLLMLSESSEQEALNCLDELINDVKINRLPDDRYIVAQLQKSIEETKEAKIEARKTLKLNKVASIPFNPKPDREIFDPKKEARELEIFNNTPEWARKPAEKYLRVIQESRGLHGDKLRFFIQKWNERYPEMKTSYSAVLRAKKILKNEGKLALLAKYNPTNKGKSAVVDELYVKFRDMFLSSKAPSMNYCYNKLKEDFEKENPVGNHYIFPSTSSFLRRLRRDFTQAEISYYRSKTQVDFKIPLEFKQNLNLLTRNSDYSFIVASENFIKDYARLKCSLSTVASYESYLKNHLVPYFGLIKLKDIDEEKINHFVSLKINDGFSKTSINHMIKLLGIILDMCLEKDLIGNNPVKFIKQIRSSHNLPKYLQEDDIKKLLVVCKDNYPDFYPLLYTAITTGMRKGELLGLSWENVDLKNRKITVKKSLYRNNLINIKATKQARVLNITQELVDIFEDWKLKYPKGDLDIVFPNSAGGFMDPDNMIKRRFNPIIEQAGIDNIQFQDLRNTYAYIMLSNNAILEYVQSQMGHYSVDVTFNRYGHFIPEKKEDYESVFKELAG